MISTSLFIDLFSAKAFSDRVVGFLLQKLESGNEKSKMATLGVLRHVVYSSGKLDL